MHLMSAIVSAAAVPTAAAAAKVRCTGEHQQTAVAIETQQ